MKWTFLVLGSLMIAGCQSSSQQAQGTPSDEPASTAQQSPSSNTGVTPMATPVPNAPVTGTESLQGGGSAVGTVAKDRAKQAASRASNPAGSAAPAEGE